MVLDPSLGANTTGASPTVSEYMVVVGDENVLCLLQRDSRQRHASVRAEPLFCGAGFI